MLSFLKYVVVVLFVLINLRGYIIKAELTLVGTSQLYIGEYTGQSAISIFERVDANKP